MSNYGYTKQVNMTLDEAHEKLQSTLKEQGFGVLTEIDVQQTLKEKIDKEIDEYLILGACNPSLASQAIEAEPEIGLLLPCNVIIYRQNTDLFVSALLPSAMMSAADNPKLDDIAITAEAKLKAAIDNLT